MVRIRVPDAVISLLLEGLGSFFGHAIALRAMTFLVFLSPETGVGGAPF